MNLVFKVLKKAGMRINGFKCTFYTKKVEFLGYIISSDRIKMDQKKIQAIQNWPVPRSIIEVQKFIEFANFYRRFIKGYSGIAISFIDLTRKDRTFAQTENEQFIFKELKRRFLKAPILTVFNPELPIILETDVSDYAIRACII